MPRNDAQTNLACNKITRHAMSYAIVVYPNYLKEIMYIHCT